jgi:hypothetical protein
MVKLEVAKRGTRDFWFALATHPSKHKRLIRVQQWQEVAKV